MAHLVSILHPRQTESQHQDLLNNSLDLLPEGEVSYRGGGVWIDLADLGFDEQPEDGVAYGAGQVIIDGEGPLSGDVSGKMRILAQEAGAEFFHHPYGGFQGNARTADGRLVWVEGLAAQILEGNAFDMAFEGRPVALVFIQRLLPMATRETGQLLSDCIANPELRPQARQALEQDCGISFADDQLYYARGEDGLSNIFSVRELDQIPVVEG